MENVLEKLFESIPKVRILRLFMQNADRAFTLPEIAEHSVVPARYVRKELEKLRNLGIISKNTVKIKYEVQRKSKKRNHLSVPVVKNKKAVVYTANQEFPLFSELRDLITKAAVASRKKLLPKLKGLGRVRLAVVAGVFLHDAHARTDLFLVGDKIRMGRLERLLTQLESDLGRSIQYTLMTTDEFKYRTNMYDRFIRDIFEHNHEKLINQLRV
jgi:DNA-binding Lrp family transcriptional regulator